MSFQIELQWPVEALTPGDTRAHFRAIMAGRLRRALQKIVADAQGRTPAQNFWAEVVEGYQVTQTSSGDDLELDVTNASPRWGWLELGTRPHLIEARNHPFLVFQTQDGGWVKTRSVQHPGTQGQHIFEAAWDRGAEDIDAAITGGLESFITSYGTATE